MSNIYTGSAENQIPFDRTNVFRKRLGTLENGKACMFNAFKGTIFGFEILGQRKHYEVYLKNFKSESK